MTKRFIVTFRTGERGRLLGERPGYNRYLVFADRSSEEQPKPYTKYLVEIVNDFPVKRYCFVRIIRSVPQIWAEIEPALLAATWQRGRDAFSAPWTEIKSLNWGLMRVEFNDSRGRSGQQQFAYVKLNPDGEFEERLSFEVSSGAEVNFGELAKLVHRQVGSQAALGAVISRQADSRIGRRDWHR